MNVSLKALDKYGVFKNFGDLTNIPRESGNEQEVSDFLVAFANKHNLHVIQDEHLNVIIKKPATEGLEASKTVILQGHMDMVCTKLESIDFNFSKDVIKTVVDGDFLRTQGTTLGADNGIAVAMAMSVLESTELSHPPLVALFTVGEETGMDGVLGLNPDHVKGDILINIDSEEEGTILASCAGGVNSIITLPLTRRASDANKHAYKVIVTGLLGGHSGMEINKKRANAVKLMGRILVRLSKNMAFDLSEISGGEKMNAMPKFSDAILLIDPEQEAVLDSILKDLKNEFYLEHEISDPNINIKYTKVETPAQVFNEQTKEKVLALVNLIPLGINSMSANIEGLVESSNNLGVIVTNEEEMVISCAVRSSIKSHKNEINDRIELIAHLVGAQLKLVSDYPEWSYQVDSPIRDLMQDIYQNMYKQPLKVDAIHAGLECGFLTEKLGAIDMISMGPFIYDVHTPNEHLSISSSIRVYEFLCEVLANIK